MTISFRHASPGQLSQYLLDARARTLALFDCFLAAGLDAPDKVPRLAIINPPLWELGHVAWFAEWYILREAHSSAPGAARGHSLLARADEWFDSNTMPHDARWQLDLPGADDMKRYCGSVLERILEKLAASAGDDAALYPFRLALAHEDMHGEAFAYTLNTLGIGAPLSAVPEAPGGTPADLCFAGGAIELGSRPHDGFVFDNEKWARRSEVPAFAIGSLPVANGQYREFVEAGGYRRPECWTPQGREWLLGQRERQAPAGWTRHDGRWHGQRFGRAQPLRDDEAVRHVSLHEARAYCAWAGRRLPTEAEWQLAAQSGHPDFRWGQVWEWTDTVFAPFEGFAADAYREYSQPFFHTHQVVRGASFATPPRLRSARFRNFYLPQRDDFFIGFRTCPLTPAA